MSSPQQLWPHTEGSQQLQGCVTPLSMAASGGHTEVLRALLAAGAWCNVSSEDYSTLLHDAAAKGHLDAVQAKGAELVAATPAPKLMRQPGRCSCQQALTCKPRTSRARPLRPSHADWGCTML